MIDTPSLCPRIAELFQCQPGRGLRRFHTSPTSVLRQEFVVDIVLVGRGFHRRSWSRRMAWGRRSIARSRRDVAFECGDAVVDAAADLAVGEEPEPAFDLVQPRGAGRGEVQMESWVGGEPGADRRGLVGGQVVADQMHVQFGRHALIDLGQELLELGRAVLSLDAVDDQPGRHVQRGEQISGPGAGVVEGSALVIVVRLTMSMVWSSNG